MGAVSLFAGRRSARRVAICVLGLAAGALAASAAGAQEEEWRDSFPQSPREAYDVYEKQVPIDKWLEGPVEYIVLGYERDIWKELQTDTEREAFRTWFWSRRDVDPRDDKHPYREEFYKRVAQANQRFHGYPNGWRSDRGRVWIVLGPPTGGLRRIDLRAFGRCSAESGEWWTYNTQGMAFNSSFGEFHVVFVETRVGQFEICEPSMLGLGAWPRELRQAMEYTNEAAVIDTVTEFDATGRVRRAAGAEPGFVHDVEAATGELSVPLESFEPVGVGGMAVIPVRVPLRDLFFEPADKTIVATLVIDATMVGLGEAQGRGGEQTWRLELDAETAQGISAASLWTALVLPVGPGGYSLQLRVTDPLSEHSWVWEGPVEVQAEGRAVSPPFVGSAVVRLRAGGEVGVLAPEPARVQPGGPLFVVSWVRGFVPDPAAVRVELVAADGAANAIEGQALWGDAAAAGPLIFQGTVPDLRPGVYTLRLRVSDEVEAAETRVEVR